MNIDHILETLNTHQVAFLLVGGVHFLPRHAERIRLLKRVPGRD
jgi:hypothetical protein